MIDFNILNKLDERNKCVYLLMNTNSDINLKFKQDLIEYKVIRDEDKIYIYIENGIDYYNKMFYTYDINNYDDMYNELFVNE